MRPSDPAVARGVELLERAARGRGVLMETIQHGDDTAKEQAVAVYDERIRELMAHVGVVAKRRGLRVCVTVLKPASVVDLCEHEAYAARILGTLGGQEA